MSEKVSSGQNLGMKPGVPNRFFPEQATLGMVRTVSGPNGMGFRRIRIIELIHPGDDPVAGSSIVHRKTVIFDRIALIGRVVLESTGFHRRFDGTVTTDGGPCQRGKLFGGEVLFGTYRGHPTQ